MANNIKRCRKCRPALSLNRQGLCPHCLQKRKETIADRRKGWEQSYSQDKCYDDSTLDAACDLANHFSDVSDWARITIELHAQLVRARREFTRHPNDNYCGQEGGARVYSDTYRGRALVMTQRS